MADEPAEPRRAVVVVEHGHDGDEQQIKIEPVAQIRADWDKTDPPLTRQPPAGRLGGVMTERDTRAQVEQLIRQNPARSAADVARALGITRQRVQRILADLGYTLRKTWRKT